MSKITPESVKNVIEKLPSATFSFEQLREHVAGDYDTLKDTVFALLGSQQPVIKQVFDRKTQTILLTRVKS